MQKTSHAIFHRIYVRLGLAAALVGGIPLTSHAAYANLTPPSGWSPPGTYAVQQTANKWIANAAKSSAMLNAGGRQITLPVRLRMAATTARAFAQYGIKNPWVIAGLTVGSVAYEWYHQSGYRWKDGKWEKSDPSVCTQAPCFEYRVDFGHGNSPWTKTALSACHAAISAYGLYGAVFESFDGVMCVMRRTAPGWGDTVSSIAGARQIPPSGTVFEPASAQDLLDFEEALSQKAVPDLLPEQVPGVKVPVDLPSVNPGTDGKPKPLFIPTGDPVRNPKYDPNQAPSPTNQPWIQPGVEVTPRPTTENPWQVNVQPVDRPQAGPDPKPDSEQNPNTDPNDRPKEEDSKSLCEKHPDILACQKPELDTPDDEIPKTTKDVSLQEENLFGGGSCPADVYFAPHGLQQMKLWDWNKACSDISTYVKPILIICCMFTAFLILVPGKTE